MGAGARLEVLEESDGLKLRGWHAALYCSVSDEPQVMYLTA